MRTELFLPQAMVSLTSLTPSPVRWVSLAQAACPECSSPAGIITNCPQMRRGLRLRWQGEEATAPGSHSRATADGKVRGQNPFRRKHWFSAGGSVGGQGSLRSPPLDLPSAGEWSRSQGEAGRGSLHPGRKKILSEGPSS